MPALLTKTSSPPSCSASSSITSPQPASSVVSSWATTARRPSARTSSAVSWAPFSSECQVMPTSMPGSASATAVARPMPESEPVTIAFMSDVVPTSAGGLPASGVFRPDLRRLWTGPSGRAPTLPECAGGTQTGAGPSGRVDHPRPGAALCGQLLDHHRRVRTREWFVVLPGVYRHYSVVMSERADGSRRRAVAAGRDAVGGVGRVVARATAEPVGPVSVTLPATRRRGPGGPSRCGADD